MRRLLGINGSLRRGSYNGALLELASSVCPADVRFTEWRGLADIPAFNEDLESSPPLRVIAFRAELVRADAVLFATPEYNTSIPGALKNALDWASRPISGNPLRNKPAAVIGASQGAFGGVWAQSELRKVLIAIGARVDERSLAVARAHEAFAPDGTLHDAHLSGTLTAIVHDLAREIAQRAA